MRLTPEQIAQASAIWHARKNDPLFLGTIDIANELDVHDSDVANAMTQIRGAKPPLQLVHDRAARNREIWS